MDTQATEAVISIDLTSLPLKENLAEAKSLFKVPYPQKIKQQTDFIPKQLHETQFFETQIIEEVPVRLEGLYKETIREWWFGQVEKIHFEEGYFEANLKDLKGIEVIAEFNIDSEYQESSDGDKYLFPGANFIFYVAIKHGRGYPETVSRLEFTTPHIWREEDNKRVEELYKALFPNDPSL